MKTIGGRLKFRRDQLGLTQTEVAKRISDILAPRGKRFSQQAYNHLESGKSKNSSELPAIADVLGVDLKWLRDGTGPAPKTEETPPTASLAERFHAATMKRLPEANQESLQSSELLEVLRVILDVPLTDHLSSEELQKRIELAQSVVRQLKRSERPH